MSKIIGEINLIVAYLEIIDDRIDLVEELCTSRRDVEKKKFNLIKDRFSKAKDVLGNKEFMKELYLTDLRVEVGKSVKEISWQSFEKELPEQMRKCEEVIQSGTLSKGSLECFKQLCPLLLIAKVDQLYHSQLYSWDASKFRSTEYPHPSADAVESLKDLAVLVHVEEICYIFWLILVLLKKDVIWFAECLKDRHWSYDVTSTIEIPRDN